MVNLYIDENLNFALLILKKLFLEELWLGVTKWLNKKVMIN